MQEPRGARRKCRWILLLVMGIVTAFILVRRFEWDQELGIDLGDNPPVRYASGILLGSLVHEKKLPAEPTTPGNVEPTWIYVLGGSQESLKWRLPLAASIYHRVSGGRLIFMNVRGITEYNPVLGRNYTHDEWVTHVMTEARVPATDIESIAMPEGIFGTLGEARHIATLVKKSNQVRLILVTSAYHTKRVSISFSRFLNGQGELYIYGSDERIPFHQLMAEYIKVLFYRYLLIPFSGWLA